MTLLALDGLDVAYGNVQALRGVALEIGDGEMVALLGANGAGKTTTLRVLMGLIKATAGEVLVYGHPLTPGSPADMGFAD